MKHKVSLLLFKRALLIVISLLVMSCEESVTSVSDNDTIYPVFIPIAANSYVTAPKGVEFLDYATGKFKSNWCDPNYVTTTYFRVSECGELRIALFASNHSGSGEVCVTVDGKSTNVVVSGDARLYDVATIEVKEPRYVAITMQGVSYDGKYFAKVDGFRIGGDASKGELIYVSDAELKKEDGGAYFIQRGVSTSLFYEKPKSNTRYFYNEVVVDEEDVIEGSYYMLCGFTGGYMGIQSIGEGVHKVLFSVWSQYATDDPNAVPDDYAVKTIRSGDGVVVRNFGSEGSGAQSFLDYDWKSGKTYSCMVQAEPDGAGNTTFTGYFYDGVRWYLLASFKQPKSNTYITSPYSFLENFYPAMGIYSRKVHYKNQWVYSTSGEWEEMVSGCFSCDNTGLRKHRYDYNGYIDESDNSFVLRSFGFTPDHTPSGTTLERKGGGIAPKIDFDALEKL